MLQMNKNTNILLSLLCMLALHGCATLGEPRDGAVNAGVPSVPPAARNSTATRPPEPVKKAKTTQKAEPVKQAKVEKAVVEAPVAQPKPLEAEEEAGVDSEISTTGTHILLSGSAPAYREIAERLNQSMAQPTTVHTLSGVAQDDDAIVEAIRQSADRQVVAVGLRAATAARRLGDKRVVFCQVVNYRDHDLVSDNMKGVSALPSPRKLFKDWKTLSPQLDRVLVVSGEGFDEFMQVAHAAAKQQGVTLVHRVVGNDREFLYAVKRNQQPVQGHWLLADNRVLSVKTLKEVMAFNSKEAIQTVVFQSELLDFGGLFYVMPSSREISDKVIARLNTEHADDEVGGADVLLLDDHRMGINSQVARQLGLQIPEPLKASIHVQ